MEYPRIVLWLFFAIGPVASAFALERVGDRAGWSARVILLTAIASLWLWYVAGITILSRTGIAGFVVFAAISALPMLALALLVVFGLKALTVALEQSLARKRAARAAGKRHVQNSC